MIVTLHDLIETHKDEILRQWTSRMLESAFAEGLSAPELVGAMSEYLSSLGATSPADPVQLDGEQRELVERHLASRLRQGATLNEILSEFASLRAATTRSPCISRSSSGHDASPAHLRPGAR